MANDAIAACVAANRDVPSYPPGPFQDCSDVIHIAVFFDGTGNNDKEDQPTKKWSNVARIFFASFLRSQEDKTKTTYPIYISGVGTPYNGKPVGWLSAAGVWIQDGKLGGGAGAGGDRRLDQGDDAVNDRLRDVLIANALKLGGDVSKYAATGSAKSFEEVNSALGKHRLIKVINLSIFGFSRGAALARAFSNRVLDNCKQEGDQLLYNGYPLRLNFMGIFDTVASFGVPAANVQLPFMERDLVLSSKIERCVHYVAAHEVRFSFPVDLIRKKGQFANSNWLEKTYPGVHSDVGGGYLPVDQGVDNNYARIPMRDMMREAVTGGVRMWSYKDIEKINYPAFEERFECKTETEDAYKAYMAACGPVSGTIEKQMTQHMKTLYSACGTMQRTGLQTPAERSVAEGTRSAIGYSSMAREIEIYREPAKEGKWVRFNVKAREIAQFVKPQAWQIAAWDTNVPKEAMSFVSKFVHDSKLNISEPFSYFKPRGVDESTVNIWQEGGRWLGGKATAAGDAIESGYKATEKQVVKAADYTQKKVTEGADYTERKAKEGIAYAKQKEQEAEDYAKRKYKEGEEYVNKKVDQAEREAERLYDKGSHWVKSTKDELVKETNEAATATKKQAGKVYDESAKVLDKAGKEIKKESNELYGAAKKFFGF